MVVCAHVGGLGDWSCLFKQCKPYALEHKYLIWTNSSHCNGACMCRGCYSGGKQFRLVENSLRTPPLREGSSRGRPLRRPLTCDSSLPIIEWLIDKAGRFRLVLFVPGTTIQAPTQAEHKSPLRKPFEAILLAAIASTLFSRAGRHWWWEHHGPLDPRSPAGRSCSRTHGTSIGPED